VNVDAMGSSNDAPRRREDRAEVASQLEALAMRRWRVALRLTAIMVATYFGFLLLVAWDKETLGVLVVPGLSVGILLGALVIVVAWVLTGVYVVWANRHYDGALSRLRSASREDPP
jgi:uncharacterized membrane protein (DUF485 family)